MNKRSAAIPAPFAPSSIRPFNRAKVEHHRGDRPFAAEYVPPRRSPNPAHENTADDAVGGVFSFINWLSVAFLFSPPANNC